MTKKSASRRRRSTSSTRKSSHRSSEPKSVFSASGAYELVSGVGRTVMAGGSALLDMTESMAQKIEPDFVRKFRRS